MKQNYPNNSTDTSNVYMADDWRIGILRLKKQLTCDNPQITISGVTATINLSFKGGGGEFWNVENKTVNLAQDKTPRAIYVHSDTSTTDNVSLRTFVLNESTFNIPTSETGVNTVIATIQGTDLSTLVWQFESHCKFKARINFAMYVANDLNFECNSSLTGNNVYGEIALSCLNNSGNDTKYYRALLSGTNHYRNNSNIICGFYNFFNYPTDLRISAKSVTGTDSDLALINSTCVPTESNDRYTSVDTFVRNPIASGSKPIIKFESTMNPQNAEFIFSNLGKNTIIWGILK